MAKGLSKEMKARIIDAYHDKRHPSDIAVLFKCHRTTVDRIIAKFNTDGRVDTKQRGGYKPKILKFEHETAIREWISENCSLTLNEIRNRLLHKYSIEVGVTCIHNALESFSYTLKRVSLIPIKRNNAATIEARSEYAREFYSLISIEDGSDIYFVDEVGVNISMRSRRGRAPKGQAAVHVVPGLRSKNISLCCAMSKQGMLHYKKVCGAFNRVSFAEFLDDIFEKFREMRVTNRILVMDNVPFHKCTEVRQRIVDEGHRVHLLPPYSPFLNPIENLFSQWKQLIRNSNAKNEQELLIAIDDSLGRISVTHCTNYYLHMLKMLPRCIAREEITDE